MGLCNLDGVDSLHGLSTAQFIQLFAAISSILSSSRNQATHSTSRRSEQHPASYENRDPPIHHLIWFADTPAHFVHPVAGWSRGVGINASIISDGGSEDWCGKKSSMLAFHEGMFSTLVPKL